MNTRTMQRKLVVRAYLISFTFLTLAIVSLKTSLTAATINGVVFVIWIGTAIAEHIKLRKMKSGLIIKYDCDPRTTEDIIGRLTALMVLAEVEVISWGRESKPRDHYVLLLRLPNWVDDRAILTLGSTLGIIEIGELGKVMRDGE